LDFAEPEQQNVGSYIVLRKKNAAKMIVVKLQGGLGNQMFQYACGYALAKKHQTTLKLDIGSFSADSLQRTYSLDLWGIKTEFATQTEINTMLNPSLAKKLMSALFRQQYVLKEPANDWRYFPAVGKVSDNVYLDGYWQSAKYFRHCSDDIAHLFSPDKLPLLDTSKALFDEICTGKSVCVNVRRGDFLTNNAIGFVGLDYYKRAYDRLVSLENDLRFYVFSDDMAWCNENFTFVHNVLFVDHQHAGARFSTYFRLMASCKHFIIPNSSFAWWAAWLAMCPHKRITAPANYLADPEFKIDVIPDNWIKI
jgi:hypothetical protein